MGSRKLIAKTLIDLATFYGQELSERQLEMYVDVMEHFDDGLFATAVKEYLRDPKNTRFPIPPHSIIAKLHPEPDSKFVALDLARKIDRAISRHGYVWEGGYAHSSGGHYWEAYPAGKSVQYASSFKDAVILELGEIGWHTICVRGGWQALHASQKNMDEGQFIAQLRDQVQASYSLAKQGIDVAAISLPVPREDRGEQNVLDFIEKHRPQSQEEERP